MVALGRCRRAGGADPRASGRRRRDLAAARRHPLRGLRLAARIVAAAPARRGFGRRQLRDAARAGRLHAGSRPPVRASAGDRAHRLPRASLRSGATRGARTARVEGVAAAARRRGARDDAGDDVRAADLCQRRRGRSRAPAAARVGEPDADAPCAAVFGGAVLAGGAARPAAPAARNGCAGGAGARRGVRGQRPGDVDGRGQRLFRFGDDVHRLAFCWPGTPSLPPAGARATRWSALPARGRPPRCVCRPGPRARRSRR